MNEKEVMDRTSLAVSYFEQGYNCSQSVFMAYSDLYGIDKDLAMKLSTSFGGGMGRLREVCGAVSGMCLILSMHYPFTNPNEKESKDKNYRAVQRTVKEFKDKMGSYICADLLEIKREAQSPESSERNIAYYQTRQCTKCVALAAEIVGKEILT